MTVHEAKLLLGYRYDADLARLLELTPQSVNNYRKAGAIPSHFEARITLEAIKKGRAPAPVAAQG